MSPTLPGVADRLLLVRGIHQLVTLLGPAEPRRRAAQGQLHTIPDAALLIRNGRIEVVGSSRRVENLQEVRHAIEINLQRQVVIPAFADPGLAIFLREKPSKARKGEGGVSVSKPVIPLDKGSRRLAASHAEAWARRLLNHGSCRAAITVDFSGDEYSTIKSLRAWATLGNGSLSLHPVIRLIATHPENGQSLAEQTIKDLLPAVRRLQLAEFLELTLTDFPEACIPPLIDTAKSFGMGLRLRFTAGRSPGRLSETVAASAVAVLGTADMLPEPLIAALRNSNAVTIVSAPPIRCSAGANARVLIDSGVPVALATDFNTGTPSSYSQQASIALAVANLSMSVEEALCAVTFNAAHALNCGNSTGSIEPGKSADLLFLDIRDYHELGTCFGVNHVSGMLRRGALISGPGARAVLDRAS